MERYRTTVILVVVLAALAGVAFFLNQRNSAGGNASPTTTPTHYIWQSTDPVTAIDVVSGTQRVSVVEDTKTTLWRIASPFTSDADGSVQNSADALKSLAARDVLTGSTNLADYELDKPGLDVTVTFSDTAHTKRSIQIGKTTFDGAAYYVKEQSSGKIYTVSNGTIEPLRTWLTTPPKAQPTATLVPITVVPTAKPGEGSTATPLPTPTP